MRFRSALLTGASGFIGRVLAQRLQREGARVVCVARPGASLPDGVVRVEVERLERASLLAGLAECRCEIAFHLAAYGVAPNARAADAMFAVNVGGTAAVVEAAAHVGARALVYAGSCSEYEPASGPVPLSEDGALTRSALYGASKAAGGLWGQAHAHALGLPFQWLRVFGVYGPGEAAHRLLPSLAHRLNRAEPVPLTPGEQQRDFLYVEDVVDGLLLAAEAAREGRLGPFNLCSGEPVTVKTFAKLAAKQLGRDEALLRFGDLDYRLGEPLWLVGAPERFRDATGFRPSTPLEAGIARSLTSLR